MIRVYYMCIMYFMCISCIVVNLLGTLGVRVAGHVTASGPLGTCLQIIIGVNFFQFRGTVFFILPS